MSKSFCQSCSMPMSKDPLNGGSETDGSRSAIYCSLCYENGSFIYESTDVKAYQKYVVDAMVTEGWMRPIAWLLTRGIPKLERWRA